MQNCVDVNSSLCSTAGESRDAEEVKVWQPLKSKDVLGTM